MATIGFSEACFWEASPKFTGVGFPNREEGVEAVKHARIILADDHVLLLGAFKSLLEPEFEVVCTFQDGRALVEGAPIFRPDVIVLDIGMPLMNGLCAGQQLKKMMPAVKLIYLTMNLDSDLAAEAFRLGASGYLLKSSATSELLQAIREALIGRSYVTPLITEGMVGSFVYNLKHKKPAHMLTWRQKEVLQLLVEGQSMKEIAAALNVTTRTVAFHKYTMMEQLGIKTSAELIQYAIKHSIAGSN
jgi:DNA-binding NarL/FixJ family response regulator